MERGKTVCYLKIMSFLPFLGCTSVIMDLNELNLSYLSDKFPRKIILILRRESCKILWDSDIQTLWCQN